MRNDAAKTDWQMIPAGGNEKPADPLEAVDELALAGHPANKWKRAA